MTIGRPIITATAALLCCTATLCASAAADGNADCLRIAKEIQEIRDRMRSGYTAPAGKHYEERLRKLKQRQYKLCRKK